MTTPDDRALDPASIASVSFTTVRRGFDPNEVRAYLQQLSGRIDELARREEAARAERDELRSRPAPHAELDDATVAAWLGEEAARVLTTARDAANQVRTRAEDQAEQLRAEVEAETARLTSEAHAEVERLQQEVAIEVERRRQESVAEAEAEIETARQEGRGMVSEARAVRERMLADLSRRRDGARSQLSALRGERDRIVNAIEATRDHLDRLMDDLRSASPEDDRELPGMPYEQDPRAVVTGEPRLTLVRPLHPVHQDLPPGEEPVARDDELAVVDEVVADEVVVVETVVVDGVAGTDEADAGGAGAEEGPGGAEAAPDDTRGTDAPEVVVEALEVTIEPVPPAEDELDVEDPDRPSVDDVFARIRAARTGAVAGAAAAAEAAEEAPDGAAETDQVEAEPLDPDAELVRARDEAVAPLQTTLTRQLKRALADEQNEVFDRLRRLHRVADAEQVLGGEQEHAERYRAAGEDAAWGAALLGARSTAPDELLVDGGLESALDRHSVLDEVLDELTIELATPLREQLAAALGASGGDPEEATGLLRNTYREWKSQRIDEVASGLIMSAYGRGAYASVPPGTLIRWVVDRNAPQCAADEANALGGPRPLGEPFPTGHRHAPAHAGCRCLIEATHG